MKSITSFEELQDLIRSLRAVAFYCSTPTCGVCKSIKPKVIELVERNFPSLGLYYVDTDAVPEARGQLSVYSVPAFLCYFEGKETIREARNFGISELGRKIERYYDLLFGNENEGEFGGRPAEDALSD
jgi:thiol-disulfide isomerase/thioredoxin